MFKTLLFQGVDEYVGVSAMYLSLFFKKEEIISRFQDVEPLLERISTVGEKDLEELCRFYALSL